MNGLEHRTISREQRGSEKLKKINRGIKDSIIYELDKHEYVSKQWSITLSFYAGGFLKNSNSWIYWKFLAISHWRKVWIPEFAATSASSI